MKHRDPNTQCTRCGKPIFRQPSARQRNTASFCSRACLRAARKDKTDGPLAYVAESMATQSVPEMAQHLQISRSALAYRIACWRQAGLLGGHNRCYNPRHEKKPSSKYFRWKDFENDVIVGGNLKPDEVVVSGR